MPRGTCTIFNWNGTHDLKNEFGVSLSDGAISTLLAPPAAKERVSNASRLEHGKRVDIRIPTRYEARELTLEMHLIAPDYATLLANYRAFFAALVYSPEGIILTFEIYGQTVKYRLQYLSCTPFAVYGGKLAKFAVRFIERNPSNLGAESISLNALNGGGEDDNTNDGETNGEE